MARATVAVGPYRLVLNSSLYVVDTRTEHLLWSTLSDVFVETAVAHDEVTGASGCESIHRHDKHTCASLGVASVGTLPDGSVSLSGGFGAPCKALGWDLTFSLADEEETALRFSLALNSSATAYDRLALKYARLADERFFGFGQQYTYLNAAGAVIPIFAREGGIGRGLEPITYALNAFRRQAGGTDRTTYSATPHYITSALRSFHLTNTEPAEFDLTTAQTVRVEVSATAMHGRMLGDSSPLNLLRRVTAFTGRMGPLPDWSHAGVIVGIQGGTGRVAQMSQRMVDAGVRLSGVWLQDWGGVTKQTILGFPSTRLQWNWRLDTSLYSNWAGKHGLLTNLSKDGVKVYSPTHSGSDSGPHPGPHPRPHPGPHPRPHPGPHPGPGLRPSPITHHPSPITHHPSPITPTPSPFTRQGD